MKLSEENTSKYRKSKILASAKETYLAEGDQRLMYISLNPQTSNISYTKSYDAGI